MGIFNSKPDPDMNENAPIEKESQFLYRTLSFFGFYYSKKKAMQVEAKLPPAKGVRLFFRLFFREFFNLIKLNFLFYLFCIPIITIPAAYSAMTRITTNMVREEEYFMWDAFLKTFRMEFKKATVAGALLLVGFASFSLAIWYYGSLASMNSFFWIPTVIAALGVLMLIFVGFSLFPMLVVTGLTLKECIKNAFFLIPLSILNYFTVFMVCAILIGIGIVFFPESLIFIIIYPSLLNFIIAFGSYSRIKKYVLRKGSSDGV